MSEWGECVTHHACDCIKQEMDRLRRAADSDNEIKSLAVMKYEQIKAERDELKDALRESQHANTEWARQCDGLKAERDRYRAALELIAKQHNGDELNVALDALNGGTDD